MWITAGALAAVRKRHQAIVTPPLPLPELEVCVMREDRETNDERAAYLFERDRAGTVNDDDSDNDTDERTAR